MSQVFVNGRPYEEAATAASWSELLDAIDQHASSTGTIVAGVRFDGIDEPGFREPAVLIRRLETDLIVEIDMEQPGILLGRVLDEGAASIPALEQSAHELARTFRGAHVHKAAQGLGELAESLMNLVALVAVSAEAADVRLDTLALDGEPVGGSLVALDAALGPLLEAQAAGDYITVADTLEYEVGPAIPRLLDVIDALRVSAGAC